jgi:hypothetical protein
MDGVSTVPPSLARAIEQMFEAPGAPAR